MKNNDRQERNATAFWQCSKISARSFAPSYKEFGFEISLKKNKKNRDYNYNSSLSYKINSDSICETE